MSVFYRYAVLQQPMVERSERVPALPLWPEVQPIAAWNLIDRSHRLLRDRLVFCGAYRTVAGVNRPVSKSIPDQRYALNHGAFGDFPLKAQKGVQMEIEVASRRANVLWHERMSHFTQSPGSKCGVR